MAIGDATKEALWLRSLLSELAILDLYHSTCIMVDNQGSIHLAKNPLISECAKHIDIQHHFICDHIEDGDVTLIYCPTSEMTADIFTKPLDRIKHWRFVYALGLHGDSIPVGDI